MTKWGDRPHWQIPACWLGQRRARRLARHRARDGDGPPRRPRRRAEPAGGSRAVGRPRRGRPVVGRDVPRAGRHPRRRGVRRHHHAAGAGTAASLRAVDLDLDVVEGESGRVWIDDEDEFAQHKVALGYPDDVVAAAMRSCDRVQAALSAGHPPYDGSHQRWLSLLRRVGRERLGANSVSVRADSASADEGEQPLGQRRVRRRAARGAPSLETPSRQASSAGTT